MLVKQVLQELKVTAELLEPQEPKVTKERGAHGEHQVKQGSMEHLDQLDRRELKDLEVNKVLWDFLVPEDHLDFLETSGLKVFQGSKVHQVLLEFLVNLELQENQVHLVKLLLQLALMLWRFLAPLVPLDPQVLLEPRVCLGPLVRLESLELLVPKERRESQERRERRVRKVRKEIKEEKEIKETVESQVPAPALSLSVPQSPANYPLLLDLQVHLVPLDLQDHLEKLERPDHRVLQVKASLVPQDAKVLQVLQALQGSARLDLKAIRENQAALCRRQKHSLRDHQDLQDPQVQRVQQVNPDNQGHKGNQANQGFLEARENQAMVSPVSLGPQDRQVQPLHQVLQAPLDPLDLLVRAVTLLM